MTARILLLGAADYDERGITEVVLEKMYLTLRPETDPPLLLLTMGQQGPEQWAAEWWVSHGLQIEPARHHANKYVTLNALITSDPDALLVFGYSNLLATAVKRAETAEIRTVKVGEAWTL